MLSGTMSLAKRVHPETKMREKHGFVTAIHVPDCNDEKKKQIINNLHYYDHKTKKYELLPTKYVPPSQNFREEKEIIAGEKDFISRVVPDPLINPHSISVFQEKPRFVTDKENMLLEKAENARKQALCNKNAWYTYFKKINKSQSMAQHYPDKHNKFNGPKREESDLLQ